MIFSIMAGLLGHLFAPKVPMVSQPRCCCTVREVYQSGMCFVPPSMGCPVHGENPYPWK